MNDISLDDRFDLNVDQVLLNGTQALVRLMLMQRARDLAAGLNTAGYVTGYRGSPLGAVDFQMTRAAKALADAQVKFQPGLNEDLAATALWGTQQAELRGQGRYDGVFGLWYGKGPGVDRSGDVMRHVNFAGTSPHGGVIMAMGDDHTGESSTTLHQSDGAMVEAIMPIVSPAGVQEVLDYGLYAWALSRYCGLWVGLKTMKDTIEVTSVVDGNPHRLKFVLPDFVLPDGGLNIRLHDTPALQEARAMNFKRPAAEAFARANKIDQRKWGKPGAKIGLVAAGKNWLDLEHALSLLGCDAALAEAAGITTYKIGQVWPLDVRSFNEFAAGLDLIIVVEEKRKLIEGQIKDALYHLPNRPRVYGWRKGDTDAPVLFPTTGDLSPTWVARQIGEVLIEEGCDSAALRAGLASVTAAERGDNAPELAGRTPYFCAGCPHNSGTKLPEGSRAYAGIGCHYLAQFMGRETLGFTQMGGEGANWVGEAPFSKQEHVFQNIGDGTYNHSGLLAIRFAVMAGTTMTYKILYNDAVAMTGGQGNDGGMTPDQICAELLAMGVGKVALVYDAKEDIDLTAYPKGVEIAERGELDRVQRDMTKVPGVSAIVYVQTCAAEKRRRRKRGSFPAVTQRVFINTDICEGCGDCGVQSNCVAIVPVETPLGRKRAIDQSACNADYSCLQGFCPSFVTVTGGTPRKATATQTTLPEISEPALPQIDGTHNVVITGIGGTGVVTIGAVLAMAAHLDGKGASMMEMAGMAQKGGAVHIHCRIADRPEDIAAIRVAAGECDALIGGDLAVSAGAKTLGLMQKGRTRVVVNNHVVLTGDFTRAPDLELPAEAMQMALAARAKDRLVSFDAARLAESLLGDSIYSNMVVFGAAWQYGAVPVARSAILKAIALNGQAVTANQHAFEIGRWAVACPDDAQRAASADVIALPQTLEAKIEHRAQRLIAYQGKRLARRYRRFVARFEEPELRLAAAEGYYKLLAYKDEYEVARLHMTTQEKLQATFEGDLKVAWHLAPPLISRTGPDGRPVKRRFGPWIKPAFALLARLRFLRGTPLDPFGYTAERRSERSLIRQYEADLGGISVTPHAIEQMIELARLPLEIRGFGPVKSAAIERAAARRQIILAALQGRGKTLQAAE